MEDRRLKQKDKRYNEGFMKRVLNSFSTGILIAISYLPFFMLYLTSDLFYLLVRYVIKYRYNVVCDNLKHAFPQKTEQERLHIANRFYRHFCDTFVEVIKGYSISEKTLSKRFRIKNAHVFKDFYDRGLGTVAFGMHYNNWEWGSYMAKIIPHDLMLIYNPIRGNHAFERFITHIRTRWGGKAIPVNRSSRTVLNLANVDNPSVVWLGADQSAPPNSKFWSIFFNREAPFFSGPEKIAIVSNQPVVLHITRKIKRGYYEVEFITLFERPRDVEPKEILLTYIRKIEEIVQEDPAYYLWSHRRWKHTRPEGISLTT